MAAVSLADSGSGNASKGSGSATFSAPGPRGGVGVMTFRGPNLSAADRQKMEEFRKCMEDNGAPAPPDPGKIDREQSAEAAERGRPGEDPEGL